MFNAIVTVPVFVLEIYLDVRFIKNLKPKIIRGLEFFKCNGHRPGTRFNKNLKPKIIVCTIQTVWNLGLKL